MEEREINNFECKKPASDLIDGISKSLTHFVFRNGIVEDMHVAGKLSEDDMKQLNKCTHGRMAYVVNLFLSGKQEDINKLIDLIDSNAIYGSNWDRAKLDDDDFEKYFLEHKMKKESDCYRRK